MRRKDGQTIVDGPLLRTSYVANPVLNITHINRCLLLSSSWSRVHMGTYVCEAFNGVPDNATQEFLVQVHCK